LENNFEIFLKSDLEFDNWKLIGIEISDCVKVFLKCEKCDFVKEVELSKDCYASVRCKNCQRISYVVPILDLRSGERIVAISGIGRGKFRRMERAGDVLEGVRMEYWRVRKGK
jgi:hypothetical protein